ncbi:hypothetical protein BRAS3843_1720024 [Bradyrhizobium sp. STM 3843]|nr:hypothetical protein BRAS3843_1720024 [Bradyrhizobium sp. STM 3843]
MIARARSVCRRISRKRDLNSTRFVRKLLLAAAVRQWFSTFSSPRLLQRAANRIIVWPHCRTICYPA